MNQTNKPVIRVPNSHNQILKQALDNINSNEEITAMWEMTNTNGLSVKKLSSPPFVKTIFWEM